MLAAVLSHGLANGQSLEQYLWKNRLLFLTDPQGEDSQLGEQIKKFQGLETELKDRQLMVFVIRGNEVTEINGNQTELHPTRMAFSSFKGVILIGKDGGIKLQEPFVIEPQRVFDLIDSMPMRRAEMKNSEKY